MAPAPQPEKPHCRRSSSTGQWSRPPALMRLAYELRPISFPLAVRSLNKFPPPEGCPNSNTILPAKGDHSGHSVPPRPALGLLSKGVRPGSPGLWMRRAPASAKALVWVPAGPTGQLIEVRVRAPHARAVAAVSGQNERQMGTQTLVLWGAALGSGFGGIDSRIEMRRGETRVESAALRLITADGRQQALNAELNRTSAAVIVGPDVNAGC